MPRSVRSDVCNTVCSARDVRKVQNVQYIQEFQVNRCSEWQPRFSMHSKRRMISMCVTLTLCSLNCEKSLNGVKIGMQPSWKKGNNTAFVNIVPTFNRGLPKAVQGNIRLGFEGNLKKILTPLNEAKIGTYTKQTKWNKIAFLGIVPIFNRDLPMALSI